MKIRANRSGVPFEMKLILCRALSRAEVGLPQLGPWLLGEVSSNKTIEAEIPSSIGIAELREGLAFFEVLARHTKNAAERLAGAKREKGARRLAEFVAELRDSLAAVIATQRA